jgi:hypothetical protein
MRSFTLDTNCLIAVDEGRPEAEAVRALADAHAAGTAAVAVVAISASERQPGGGYIQNFGEFRARLAELGLAHLDILRPIMYWGFTFWDYSLWSDAAVQALEKRIHEILFPNVEFLWEDYCRAAGLDPASTPAGRWRNCKCDVLAIWSHIHGNRDVFVTSDGNFHIAAKKAALVALGARHIETPSDAVLLLQARSRHNA